MNRWRLRTVAEGNGHRRDWWGRDPRSWALLCAANLYLSRVLVYTAPVAPGTTEPLPTGFARIALYVPIELFGALWFFPMVAMIVVALRRMPAAGWMVLLVAPPFVWGGLYLVGSISQGSWRSFWAFDLFASFGGMVTACLLKRPSPPGPRQ